MIKLSFKITIMLITIISSVCYATETTFYAGEHYKRLPIKMRTNPEITQLRARNPNKIQVVMFFSYSCNACWRINKKWEEWQQKQKSINSDKIAIYNVPMLLHGKQDFNLAKAYYAIEAIDDTGKLNQAMFDGLHKKHLNLAKEKLLYDYVAELGVDKGIFDRAYDSFSIVRKVTRAREIAKAYNIWATPMIIINGPTASYSTSWSQAGTEDDFMGVINFLVKKELAATKK